MLKELCIPGARAIIHLAKESELDFEALQHDTFMEPQFKEDFAKLEIEIQNGTEMQELVELIKEGSFPSLRPKEMQPVLIDIVDKLRRASVIDVLVEESNSKKSVGAKSIIRAIQTGKETVEQTIMDMAQEFGPSSDQMREMAAIGQLLSEGTYYNKILLQIQFINKII